MSSRKKKQTLEAEKLQHEKEVAQLLRHYEREKEVKQMEEAASVRAAREKERKRKFTPEEEAERERARAAVRARNEQYRKNQDQKRKDELDATDDLLAKERGAALRMEMQRNELRSKTKQLAPSRHPGDGIREGDEMDEKHSGPHETGDEVPMETVPPVVNNKKREYNILDPDEDEINGRPVPVYNPNGYDVDFSSGGDPRNPKGAIARDRDRRGVPKSRQIGVDEYVWNANDVISSVPDQIEVAPPSRAREAIANGKKKAKIAAKNELDELKKNPIDTAKKWQKRYEQGKKAYDLAKSIKENGGEMFSKFNSTEVEREYYSSIGKPMGAPLDDSQKKILRDLKFDAEMKKIKGHADAIGKNLPTIAGIDLSSVANSLTGVGDYFTRLERQSFNSVRDTEKDAFQYVADQVDLPREWIDNPTMNKYEDPTGLKAETMKWAMKDMDKDWNYLSTPFSKPNFKGLKSKQEVLDEFKRSNAIDLHLQYKGILDKTSTEKYEGLRKRAKELDLDGRLSPWAAEEFLMKEFETNKAISDYIDLMDKANGSINGETPLPGSAVFDENDDDYFYGSRSFHRRVEPTFSFDESGYEHIRYQDHMTSNRWKRDPISGEGRQMMNVNSKNTALTVQNPEIHTGKRISSSMTAAYERAAKIAKTTREFADVANNPSYRFSGFGSGSKNDSQMQTDIHRESMSYDSNQLSYLPVAKPVAEVGAPRTEVASLSENRFLVGIGDDEKTQSVRVGSQINNMDENKNTGAPSDKKEQEDVTEVDEANAKNPFAPVIDKSSEVPGAKAAAELPRPKEPTNFVRPAGGIR